jgi:hypothetical protein
MCVNRLRASCWFDYVQSLKKTYNGVCNSVFWTLSIVYILIKLPGLRLAQPGGPTARVSVLLPFYLKTEAEFSFRKVVILLKYRRWTMSKKTLLQIITHHCQNPLDFIQWSAITSRNEGVE